MPDPKLLIFDLDGTLIDSLGDLTDATNYVRASYRYPSLDSEGVRALVGQGARSLVARALPGAGTEIVDEALEKYLDYNLQHIADKTRLYPGVAETLQAISEKGIAMTILSNKNVALCRSVLSFLGVDGFFAAVYGADSFPFRKPSPEPVFALLKEFSVIAQDAALVGDSINDIAAGRAAGITTVGCSYGYGDSSELKDASYVISRFPSLLRLPIFL